MSVDELPAGYRQGIITAITVILGFSLYFLRFYAVEPGSEPWSRYEEDAAAILGIGIIIQTVALFRALSLQGTTETHYVNTVRWFFAGVCVTALSVLVAIYAAA